MTDYNPDTVLTAFYFTLETLLRRSLFDLDASTMLGLMACEASPSWEHGQYLACKHIANMRSIAVSHLPQRNAFPEDTSPVSPEDFDAMTQVDYDPDDPEYCECGAHIKGTPCYLEQIEKETAMDDEEIIPQSLRADLYASQGPSLKTLESPGAKRYRALARLRQATWEATQLFANEQIVEYVQAVLREVESDAP